jgi:hypothetical protein
VAALQAHISQLEAEQFTSGCAVQLASHKLAVTVGAYEFKLEDLEVELEVRTSNLV